MIRKYIPIIFILSFLVSQSIIHSPSNTLEPGRPFEVEASVIGLIHSQSDVTATLFYRSLGQQTFFHSEMIYINGTYRYTIPSSFIRN